MRTSLEFCNLYGTAVGAGTLFLPIQLGSATLRLLLHDIHLLKTPPTDAIYGKLRFFLCVL